MRQKTLVLLGHPEVESFCSALADRVVASAESRAEEVRRIHLSDLHVPGAVVRPGREDHAPDPVVALVQEAIGAADRIVFVFPIWWGGMPGRFKSLLEQTLTPGFAFRYVPNSTRWTPLLSGKTAELIVTMDTPPWFFRTVYRDAGISELRRNVLEFCGVKVTRVRRFGPMRVSTESQRRAWLDSV